MTDLHAAIGRVQLDALPDRTAQRQAQRRVPRRRASARRPAWWCRRRRRAPRRCGTSTPSGSPTATGCAAALADRGVGTGRLLPDADPPAARRTRSTLDLPATERAAAEVLSLPVHPALSQAQLDHVVTAVDLGGRPDEPHRCAQASSGSGAWAGTTSACWVELPDVELVAAADTASTVRFSSRRSTWSTRSRTSSTAGIDMCVVATPTVTHGPIAVQLAEAGVATLIEKPLAHDAKAAQNNIKKQQSYSEDGNKRLKYGTRALLQLPEHEKRTQ